MACMSLGNITTCTLGKMILYEVFVAGDKLWLNQGSN